jgi:hypothetical protein
MERPAAERVTPLHRIRLGPPWLESSSAGRRVLTRKFGRPRTLGPGECIWLVLPNLPPDSLVTLNEIALPSAGRESSFFEADVTDRLQPRNEVAIEAATPIKPPTNAALEVRLAEV